MSELRRDPIIDRWVIIAPERANRPIELSHAPLSTESETDPFSEGNESITPGELFAIRDSGSAVNGPGWTVRAFPNKYPAVSSTAEIAINANDFYRSETAVGSHEVIVECPHDEANLSHLTPLQTRDILFVYRKRI